MDPYNKNLRKADSLLLLFLIRIALMTRPLMNFDGDGFNRNPERGYLIQPMTS